MVNEQIIVSFYGDDFTGTTATAEALMQSGLPTVIFPNPPSPEYLKKHFPRVRAVGISGIARTLPTDLLEKELEPIFSTIKSYQSPINIYKVCSTFDSSVKVGNIGKAIELGIEALNPEFVPVFPAAPRLGRYTVFGNHFAAMDDQNVYRLDCHPSISNHPITPMKDANLRSHLSKQTDLPIGLIHLLEVNEGADRINERINSLMSDNIPVSIIDCLTEENLRSICQALLNRHQEGKPIYLVGSQEVGYALGDVLVKMGLEPQNLVETIGESRGTKPDPILVLSGSCATITGKQISWAKQNGFKDIAVQASMLLDPNKRDTEKAKLVIAIHRALSTRTSIIAHTAMGPDDERIDEMRTKAKELSITEANANELLGNLLGEIAVDVVSCCALKRLVVVGGDTTGRIQRYLKIKALQVSKPIGIAAPLCYIYSEKPEFNGLEVAFKGGQIGSIDYFNKALTSKTSSFKEIALGNVFENPIAIDQKVEARLACSPKGKSNKAGVL